MHNLLSLSLFESAFLINSRKIVIVCSLWRTLRPCSSNSLYCEMVIINSVRRGSLFINASHTDTLYPSRSLLLICMVRRRGDGGSIGVDRPVCGRGIGVAADQNAGSVVI